jgi:hypothetical protein
MEDGKEIGSPLRSQSSVAKLLAPAPSQGKRVSTKVTSAGSFGYAFLAPDIIEAILNGRPPQNLTIEKLRENFPMSWAEQRMVANAIGDRQIPHR